MILVQDVGKVLNLFRCLTTSSNLASEVIDALKMCVPDRHLCLLATFSFHDITYVKKIIRNYSKLSNVSEYVLHSLQ